MHQVNSPLVLDTRRGNSKIEIHAQMVMRYVGLSHDGWGIALHFNIARTVSGLDGDLYRWLDFGYDCEFLHVQSIAVKAHYSRRFFQRPQQISYSQLNLRLSRGEGDRYLYEM